MYCRVEGLRVEGFRDVESQVYKGLGIRVKRNTLGLAALIVALLYNPMIPLAGPNYVGYPFRRRAKGEVIGT